MTDPINFGDQTCISVCIATYRRPEQLKNLLNSIVKQKLPDNIVLEIVIVDNDKEKSAETIVSLFQNTDRCKFIYQIQPEQNISLTRNLCVQNSFGDYICFIDDDEIASDNWILELYKAVNHFNADGAFGYVEPVFDNNIPESFRRREFYFTPVKNTGSVAEFYYTTNAIVKAALIKAESPPFDPAYGLTGGEDAHLFERLILKGAEFITCREAVTYEFIPESRANIKYLYNRSLRGGQAFARRTIERNNNILTRIFIAVKAVIKILVSSVILLLSVLEKRKTIIYIQTIGASVGKINAVINCYKNLY